MRVWIDLSNSPHALLFAPIARRLESLGHEVIVSARDNAQTVELARDTWPDVAVIGGESPRSRAGKAAYIVDRVRELARWARAQRADVAVSHNSYAQIVAARLLRLPVVTAMDFEGQPANHLAFRLADRLLLPRALESSGLERQGAARRKTQYYDGLKEELYLGEFDPDPDVLHRIGIPAGERARVVVARTPPSRAAYHRAKNPVFEDSLRRVATQDDVWTVVLPRHVEQARSIRDLNLPRCVVPARATPSRQLLQASDLMLGAGGTMTREAALLGVPTFSLFAGEQPAVDRWLEAAGKLHRLSSPSDLQTVVRRKERSVELEHLRARGKVLVELFVENIFATARRGAEAVY